MTRSSFFFKVWARAYETVWGGFKRLIVRDETRPHAIRHGPGRGIRIYANLAHGGTRVVLGRYEPCLMKWLAATVKDGDVIWDIGSNTGHEALICAKLAGPTGRVIAFEPNEAARRGMSENLSLNPDLAPRIHVVPFLVGSTHEPENGTVSLDALVESDAVPTPNVIKMDVEGAEGDVLKGMERLADLRCPHTFVEVHFSATLERKVTEFFSSRGIPTGRTGVSIFEVSRQDYSAWVWTTRGSS